jgi:hypothetical protein
MGVTKNGVISHGFTMIYHLVMTNIAMENPTIFKNGKPGKPSISIRAIFHHLYHGYVSHNQRVPAIYGNLNGLSEPCDFGVTFS